MCVCVKEGGGFNLNHFAASVSSSVRWNIVRSINFVEKKTIQSQEDERLGEFLEINKWFYNWESKTSQKQLMSAQCHAHILDCIEGFLNYAKMTMCRYQRVYFSNTYQFWCCRKYIQPDEVHKQCFKHKPKCPSVQKDPQQYNPWLNSNISKRKCGIISRHCHGLQPPGPS